MERETRELQELIFSADKKRILAEEELKHQKNLCAILEKAAKS